MRLLLVEDDQLLGDGLQSVLHQRGHSVDWVKDGLTAESALRQDRYDVALIDLNLPKLSGDELISRIREKNNPIPLLVLTARAQLDDRVDLFNRGADDYVIKPFEMDELEARIKALHRRHTGHASPKLKAQGIEMDPTAHSVLCEGRPISLSAKEFMTLKLLMENAGRVISRHRLEEELYSWGEEIDSNAVEVHIHHIRKKLGCNPIRTIRGVGYIIE